MNKEIEDFIKKIADKYIEILESNGYIPGGKNGPYNDMETPVRNSSHWISIYSWLFKKYGEKKYFNAAKKLAQYLISLNVKDTFYAFNCRNKDGKDHVNGTIGQAWAIEGLIESAKLLNDDKYYDLAVEIFKSHRFSKKIGCWDRKEINGKDLGYDGTFNHQLWFAAAGAEILSYKDNKEIRKQIECFLDKCYKKKTLFNIHGNGVIKHYSCINNSIKSVLYFYLRELKNNLKIVLKMPNMLYKEEGYHYFALYGFALLKEEFDEHPIFKSKKLFKAINYALNDDNYIRQLCVDKQMDGTKLATKFETTLNIYCFPYNSPFYELPFIIKTLSNDKKIEAKVDKLWKKHKEIMNDRKIDMNINDIDTFYARIYELLKAFD